MGLANLAPLRETPVFSFEFPTSALMGDYDYPCEYGTNVLKQRIDTVEALRDGGTAVREWDAIVRARRKP